MPSPKTATLRLEIINDDGSKTIVTTEELDASKLPARGAHDTSPERIIIGMVDPYYDPEDYNQRRNRWVHDTLAFVPPLETHFNLNFQLPPVKKNGPVYHIQEVEAPDKRVIVVVHPGDTMRIVTSHTEESIQMFADQTGSIYFFLDIP